MDTPIVAVVLASILSGALSAGVALFGTFKVSEKQFQIERARLEHEKARWELDARAEHRRWRMEKRNSVYGDLAYALNMLDAVYQDSLGGALDEDQLASVEAEQVLLLSNLRLHADPAICEKAQEVIGDFRTFKAENNLTSRYGTNAHAWLEARQKLGVNAREIHELVREHLDSFE